MKNKLLARSCQESYQYVSYVMFFTSREGVVGISPFFGAAFTHPYSLCSPTLTLGGVNAGSPEALNRSPQPESIWPVCELWVTFSFLDYTRLKACQLADFAPTSNPSDRRKKSGAPTRSAVGFFSWCSFIFWCRFSDVIFQCIVSSFGVCDNINFLQRTTRWRTRRQRTKTSHQQLFAFMRDGNHVLIHLAFATTSSYEMYNSVAYTTAPNKKHPTTPTCFYP